MKRIFSPTKRRKILIVDDDRNLAELYRDQLRNPGFEVEIAANNREAKQKIEEGALDLVILDFSMPGAERMGLLEQIRSLPETQALPVIAFSNPFLSHLVRAARSETATRCVTKADCTGRDFLRIVREVFAADPASVASAKPWARVNNEATAPGLPTRLDPSLLTNASETLANLRVSHYAFLKTEEEDLRRVELCEMRQQVHFLVGLAGLAGFYRVALLASSLEALFIDLHASPKNIKASVLRTISQAMDRMGAFLDETNAPARPPVPLKILVVDDEMITRKTISSVMDKAGLMVVGLNNPSDAQTLLAKDRFDLIFLDVEMPGLNGLELCARIRNMPVNRATPIVFVTGHSDFEIRAQSILKGGTDFIAKPFVSVELAVKALTWLYAETPQTVSAATVRNNSPAKIANSEKEFSVGFAPLQLSGSFA